MEEIAESDREYGPEDFDELHAAWREYEVAWRKWASRLNWLTVVACLGPSALLCFVVLPALSHSSPLLRTGVFMVGLLPCLVLSRHLFRTMEDGRRVLMGIAACRNPRGVPFLCSQLMLRADITPLAMQGIADLLPFVTDETKHLISRPEREAIWREIRFGATFLIGDEERFALTTAMLETMKRLGTGEDLRDVDSLTRLSRRTERMRTLRALAEETAAHIRARLETETAARSLLRPASGESAELLRPAGTSEIDPELLVRPSSGPDAD